MFGLNFKKYKQSQGINCRNHNWKGRLLPIVLGLTVCTLVGLKPAHAQNLLVNPGFETTGGWGYNIWGGPSVGYATETANPHSGAKAQSVTVNTLPPSSGYIFKQDVTLTSGKLYEFSIWLRSPGNCKVQFYLRTASSTPYALTQRTVDLNVCENPNWQQFKLRVGAQTTQPGVQTTQTVFFGINFLTPGTVILDDASMTDITASSLHGNGTPATTAIIPASYFGLHFNKGHNNVWPTMNQGLVRLWDSGTMWKNIEPSNDAWSWARTDMYVNSLIRSHDTSCKILMTLGQTPQWAASDPNAPSAYGAGASSAPADMNEWREYVSAVATRYAGKIHYYELWNESNVTGTYGFYTGGASKLVEMAQAARQEILAVDPNAKIVAPNVTIFGLGFLESFIHAGGDQYVDMYSTHIYTSLFPEDALINLTNMRELLNSYGINKPILDTEGRASNTTPPTATQSRAAVARNYLAKWAFGATNFSWYCYDMNNNTNNVLLSVAEDSPALSDGGIAYREVANWMTGAQMTYKGVDANGLWIVTLTRPDGYIGRVCWKYSSGVTASLPAAWGIVRRRNLDGTSSSLYGQSTTFIGSEPVLLENK